MSTFDPCGSRTLTGKDLIERLAAELGVTPGYLRGRLGDLIWSPIGDPPKGLTS